MNEDRLKIYEISAISRVLKFRNKNLKKERKQCEKDRDILKIVEAAPSLKYRR